MPPTDEAFDDLLAEVAAAPSRTLPEDAQTRPEVASPRVGDRLAHFKIVEPIGQGGMGVVYRAVDEKLGRDVALKVLPDSALGDSERRARFVREARAAAALAHPSIVTIFEIGEDDGRVFIAMELIEGQSLRQQLEAGVLDEPEALSIASSIGRALAVAHQKGIVHRDIKPDNVMLKPDAEVKVLDFGLAKWRATEEAVTQPSATPEAAAAAVTAVTQAGRIMGTPAYMSPEQATGVPQHAPSDIFSLGIVLYEMLAGKRPFSGDTMPELFTALARDEAPPLKHHRSWPLLKRALAKKPEDRPSAAEFVEALAALRAAPTSPPQRPARWPWLGVGLLAIAAAFLAARGRDAGPPSETRSASASSTAPAASEAAASAITDLPDPVSDQADALASYKQGLKSLRNADWLRAHRQFGDATTRDSNFAAAHLRLALTSHWLDPATVTRGRYRRALELRDKLSPRDAALLDALRPLIQRDPPDIDKCIELLQAASRAFPKDAELAYLPALLHPEPPAPALQAANRALALDPRYADALQQRAAALRRLGRPEEALEPLRRRFRSP